MNDFKIYMSHHYGRIVLDEWENYEKNELNPLLPDEMRGRYITHKLKHIFRNVFSDRHYVADAGGCISNAFNGIVKVQDDCGNIIAGVFYTQHLNVPEEIKGRVPNGLILVVNTQFQLPQNSPIPATYGTVQRCGWGYEIEWVESPYGRKWNYSLLK